MVQGRTRRGVYCSRSPTSPLETDTFRLAPGAAVTCTRWFQGASPWRSRGGRSTDPLAISSCELSLLAFHTCLSQQACSVYPVHVQASAQ